MFYLHSDAFASDISIALLQICLCGHYWNDAGFVFQGSKGDKGPAGIKGDKVSNKDIIKDAQTYSCTNPVEMES